MAGGEPRDRGRPVGIHLVFDLSVDGEPETVDLVREPCGGEDPLVGVSLINSPSTSRSRAARSAVRPRA